MLSPVQHRIRRLDIWGVAFVVVVGSLLHFVWEWSGRSAAVAAIGAVNESVWEHLKLAFWPIVGWGIIELAVLRRLPPNFCLAKAAAACVAPLAIVVIFYGYTTVLGRSLLALDIVVFVAAVVAGQLLSRALMSAPCRGRTVNTVACLAIVLLALAFVVFTFAPPRLPLFRDPISGGYGPSPRPSPQQSSA